MSFVYFIQAGGPDGPIKIGLTDDPQKRLLDLQVGNHEELVLLDYFEGTLEDEQALHQRMADWRLRGEWFEFSWAEREFLRDWVKKAKRVAA